jgi:hypothetical protein
MLRNFGMLKRTLLPAEGLRSRSGQTLIFLVLIVVILAFVALWQFDLHKVIYVKTLSQNGGDSAALAAARWQGQTLNLIGDLNIMQAVALTEGDPETAGAIAALQARLCYVGPMIGFMAAQQVAKNNGIYSNPDFTAMVSNHADDVRTVYPSLGADGQMLFAEPYTNCWQEYADMIQTIADNGVAAGPDNVRYYLDYNGDHLLLNPSFYDAIAGEDWCWFYYNAYEVLLNYDEYGWWPPLPELLPVPNPMNSEYYGLGLGTVEVVGNAGVVTMMNQFREDRNLSDVVISSSVANVTSVWYAFDSAWWGAWTAMSPSGDWPFPASGTVKPQYDYAGADAAARVEAEARRLTPGAVPSPISWSAAAKPFGSLDEDTLPTAGRLVLPAFRDVRLIPIDASSAPAGGGFDLDWRMHIEGHLPVYMVSGPTTQAAAVCWYCKQLLTWENPLFRQVGIDWLIVNNDDCQTTGGPGGGGGGGRRRGH